MRWFRSLAIVGAMLAGMATSATGWASARVAPYLEVQQVLDADFNNGGDVLTYTTVAAGVDGHVSTRRIEAQASYRYEHRFSWDKNIPGENIHSGVGRARLQLVQNLLALESGAVAMQSRADPRGGGPNLFTGNGSNLTQVYGGYVGPSLKTRVGDLALTADYRLGYVKVDTNDRAITLPGGQPVLDRFDAATSHDISASIGMPSGRLPFGWTVTGGYVREDASQLDQRYTGRYVRGDATLPVSSTLALTGGIGLERIRLSERSPLRDANGVPVVGRNGRYVTDKASPRLLSYETDGLIWDVGVVWRPNQRTNVTARGGRRYGGRAITASVDYRLNRYGGVRVSVYDAIDSFGRALTRSLSTFPTSFNVDRDPLAGANLGGCIFGTEPGTGGCLNDALQSTTTANYRSRGVYVMFSGTRGNWLYGLGGGYAEHKFLAPKSASLFSLAGLKDKGVTFEGMLEKRLSRASTVGTNAFVHWYDSGINGAGSVSEYGASVYYYHNFTDHLIGSAGAGMYNSHTSFSGNSAHGQLTAALRYEF